MAFFLLLQGIFKGSKSDMLGPEYLNRKGLKNCKNTETEELSEKKSSDSATNRMYFLP